MNLNKGIEINFDGIIGPTHNYAGLSFGNIASMEHFNKISNPKKGALQGLEKMRKLRELGLIQAVLPPHERPFILILRNLGFHGSAHEILQKVKKEAPDLLIACSSAAPMWAANAATISPSADSNDQRLHFTPANLLSKFHRSFESSTTGLVLFRLFNDPLHFAHHPPLPFHSDYADEGAANHTRFCPSYETAGIQLFVYGDSKQQTTLPKKFPSRQTKEAAEVITRLHRLDPARTFFAQQNPEAIDAGVFHNDVISVGNQNVFLYHEKAFVDTENIIQQLKNRFEELYQAPFFPIKVTESAVSLVESVKTYLFNSQLITLPDHSMALICPIECQESIQVSQFLKELLTDSTHPIKHIFYQDVRESMQNGGGPACLRLRIALTEKEFSLMNPGVLFTEELDKKLVKWIEKYYRDQLTLSDLGDPDFFLETRQALDELSSLLHLGSIYPFQHNAPPPKLPERSR